MGGQGLWLLGPGQLGACAMLHPCPAPSLQVLLSAPFLSGHLLALAPCGWPWECDAPLLKKLVTLSCPLDREQRACLSHSSGQSLICMERDPRPIQWANPHSTLKTFVRLNQRVQVPSGRGSLGKYVASGQALA